MQRDNSCGFISTMLFTVGDLGCILLWPLHIGFHRISEVKVISKQYAYYLFPKFYNLDLSFSLSVIDCSSSFFLYTAYRCCSLYWWLQKSLLSIVEWRRMFWNIFLYYIMGKMNAEFPFFTVYNLWLGRKFLYRKK